VDPLHHENLTVVPLIWPDPCEPTYTVLDAAIAAGTAVVPLPGVEQDLGNFARVFGGRVNRVFSGAEAEEGRARDVLRQPGFLLVATHGVNTADQPLFSHLMFQPDAENDGLLTAGELYTLPVGADLVVMSACYSGLADRSPLPGDDLFGLQRALLHSGGRAVVSGLWDVYDGTGPELMNGFFQNLHAGLSAPEALAASQRSFLRKLRESEEPEPWLHPYFWAVYKYFGDDRVRLKIDSP
jgi:CHAT domain-containing protein